MEIKFYSKDELERLAEPIVKELVVEKFKEFVHGDGIYNYSDNEKECIGEEYIGKSFKKIIEGLVQNYIEIYIFRQESKIKDNYILEIVKKIKEFQINEEK